ncbi:MAG: hypothetical protein K0U41_01100 [Gammaproteobacteria bacterium]|nr:hypothetical protein [Gammaproteobacteria bacterium]
MRRYKPRSFFVLPFDVLSLGGLSFDELSPSELWQDIPLWCGSLLCAASPSAIVGGCLFTTDCFWKFY